jgi:hypothetical protein
LIIHFPLPQNYHDLLYSTRLVLVDTSVGAKNSCLPSYGAPFWPLWFRILWYAMIASLDQGDPVDQCGISMGDVKEHSHRYF